MGSGSLGTPGTDAEDHRVETWASRTRWRASRSALSNVKGCPGPSGTYCVMSCSWHTTSYRSDSASGRAIDRGTGVTSPIQWLDSRGVSIGTGRISRCGRAAISAYRCIISRYVMMSGPPMSKTRLASRGIRALPTR